VVVEEEIREYRLEKLSFNFQANGTAVCEEALKGRLYVCLNTFCFQSQRGIFTKTGFSRESKGLLFTDAGQGLLFRILLINEL